MRRMTEISAAQTRTGELTVSIRDPEDTRGSGRDVWITLVWRDGHWTSSDPRAPDMNRLGDC